MKGEKMLDAVGCVDADLIEMAEKAGKKNAVRNAVLRYGAIAASLVLVMGGVFLAGEYISNDPPIISGEVSETKEPDESSGETVETVDLNPGASETDITETEPSSKETSGEYENPPSMGGHVPCVHSVLTGGGYELGFSYHTIGGKFIQYVGTEAFDEWTTVGREEKRAAYERGEASCPYKTIVDFVEYFDIPRDDFEILMLGSLYTDDYNVDVIYQGAEAAEKYYTRERFDEALAREILRTIKVGLGGYVEKNCAEERAIWIEKKKADGWYGSEQLAKYSGKNAEELSRYVTFVGKLEQWSIPELVSAFDIPRDVVEEAYTKSGAANFNVTFDIDALYSSTKASADYKTMNPIDIDMQYVIYPEGTKK